MIPKIIHYCWFGKKDKPKEVQDNIKKWKEKLIGFTFIEWNEENFNINSVEFVKRAYQERKFAFVSDYVRIHALYEFGGIYLDTDVEIIKPLDNLMNTNAFIGFENDTTLMTGLMASSKNHEWILDILNFYENNNFEDKKGNYEVFANTLYVTDITKTKFSFEYNKKEIQFFDDKLTIYPFEYFCAKDWKTGEVKTSNNTFSIHHYSGSWLTRKQKIILYSKRILNKFFKREKKL